MKQEFQYAIELQLFEESSNIQINYYVAVCSTTIFSWQANKFLC